MKKIIYRFSPAVSAKKIKLIKAIDKLLYLFFPGPQKTIIVTEITITQFAHIGDLILMLPALKTLKILTNYKIQLVVNSQNYKIASRIKYVDNVIVADAPWFSRGKKEGYLNFMRQLRNINTDLIFDVRGDLRNNLFIKLFTRNRFFAGYDVGGGQALLDKVFEFPHNKHASTLLEPLFDHLNLPHISFNECWTAQDVPFDIIDNVVFPDEFIVVHLGAGAQSRRWPVENFIDTIKQLANQMPVYVLGTKEDATLSQLQVINGISNVVNCVGVYSMLQSIYIVKICRVFVGLESGFSHIAGMLKKKCFILFSGTSNVDVWKPYSFYQGQLTLLKHVVECDLKYGCGKFICENNICLKHIYPTEVSFLVNEYLLRFQNDLIR
jgi:heptosyltransferase-2